MNREQGTGMLGVALRSANLLKMWLVMAAVMLAMCLLALVGTTKTAYSVGFGAPSAKQGYRLDSVGMIAFSSHGIHGGDHDIYTVEPDGSHLNRLTNDSIYEDYRPSWSPDGEKIIFEREGVGSGSHSVWIMDANGSNMRELPTRERGSNFSWSPDGTKLAFDAGNPPNYDIRDIYMIDADGSNQINLTKTPGIDEQFPDFSPTAIYTATQICSRPRRAKPALRTRPKRPWRGPDRTPTIADQRRAPGSLLAP